MEGIALFLGVTAHLFIYRVAWDGSFSWTYTAPGSGEIAIVHDILIVSVGIEMEGLSTAECSLLTGRAAEALTVLVVCGASMHDDLLQGPSVAVEYVTMIYSGAVVTVPFHPWQALGMGGGVLRVYFLRRTNPGEWARPAFETPRIYWWSRAFSRRAR